MRDPATTIRSWHRSVEAWPSRPDAGRELRATLERILAADPPPGAAPGELMRHALAEAAKLSAYESARADELRAWGARLQERDTAGPPALRSVARRVRARLRGS